ncbi:hypothetical protein [Photobacterium lucens]|uniref:hypothetical protein n=1 Tax=Photobacterium lucens TaxID=2562949 RepID=UPI00137219EF|nr:hypothetical protein [Photobacterium lucens]MBP2701639.1 hypothetical protein [Vibrio parahaemolyticus]MZG56407.1 hypothetical protein [Photobacterium lucens]MZG80727.1 hypothetical protein [Photobacterium lucens]
MLWFLMITLPLILVIAHVVLLATNLYSSVKPALVIPAIIVVYCGYSIISVSDRDALPAIILAVYYLALTVFTLRRSYTWYSNHHA